MTETYTTTAMVTYTASDASKVEFEALSDAAKEAMTRVMVAIGQRK